MKIICIGKGNDPRCLGGVETFERVLYKTFKDKIKFLVWNTNKDKIFECENVENIQEPKNLSEKILLKIFGKTRCTTYKTKKENPDIVIINKPKDIRMIKKLKCKKVLIQHGDLNTYKKTTFDKNLKLKKQLRENLDYYVFLSEESNKLFSKELELKKDQGIVIRHSCELPLLKGKKIKNKKLIMIVRLENNQKRIDLAIKAMKKLEGYTLEIYGEGEHEELLKNLVIENSLQDRVFFKGKTTRIEENLDEASIFIMTSDREGYPIAVIEALMRGLPIILRDTFESAKDIVQSNGVLLPQEWNEDEFVSAVNDVYNNYEQYSKKSIELAKRHQLEVISEQWKNLLLGDEENND